MSTNLVCPFCYTSFSSGDIRFRCLNKNDAKCAKENDVPLAEYFGSPFFMAKHVIETPPLSKSMAAFRKMTRQSVPIEVKCDRCEYPSRKHICPNCHNELPVNFHKAKSHIISIIGARDSGKTHYVTVLINELQKNGHLLDLRLSPQDVGEDRSQVTSQRYDSKYRSPLFDKSEELRKTSTGERDDFPLIYKIVSGKKKFWEQDTVYLTFYDTAGENFKDREDLRRIANYITNSSGIIFLLDTFQIPDVKKALKGIGITVPDDVKGFSSVLDSVEGLLENEGKLNKKGISKVPVAITFSKIDEPIRNNLLDDQMAPMMIRNKSEYLKTGVFSQKLVDESSEEMRSLLDRWGQGKEDGFIYSTEKLFKNVRYFGVSALGKSPVKGKLPGNEVEPHRVMDPFLWILANLNFSLRRK